MLGNYAFRPGIILSIIMLILVGLFTKLGFWQLSRAEEKQNLKETIEYRNNQPPLIVGGLMKFGPDMRFRKVVVRGIFRSDLQIFLEGKKHNGRTGYHVITPLCIAGSDVHVLINRGWIEMGRDWNTLPAAPAPEGIVEIKGTIDFPANPLFVSAPSAASGTGWGKRWPFLDLEYFASQNEIVLQPFVILQNPGDQHGFVRDWPAFDPKWEMHIGYAIQWFAFAVITAGIYLGLSVTRRKNQHEEAL